MTNLKKFFVLAAALVLALSVGADNALAQTDPRLCIADEAESLKKVRSEGITELVSDIHILCGPDTDTTLANWDNTEQTGIRVSVTLDEGVTITNARNDDDIAEDIILVLHTANSFTDGERWSVMDEWDAGNTDGVDGVNNTANGRIDGNTVEFRFGHGAIGNAAPGSTRARRFAISGIRVDATGGSNVRATISMSRTNTYDLPARNSRVTVADPTAGLKTKRQGGAIAGLTCTASKGPGSADLDDNVEAGNITLLRLEEGYAGAFEVGDMFMLKFSDVPSGVTPYLRPGDEDGNMVDTNDGDGNDISCGDIGMQLRTRLTDGRAMASASNEWEFAEVDLSSAGSGEAYYRVTKATEGATAVKCDIPIYWRRAAGAGLGTAMVAGSFAPASTVKGYASSAPIPRYVETTASFEMISIDDCSTTLLFPFVTNQAQHDTGIVIANTSMDAFGTDPHNGKCTIHYHGSMGDGEAAPSSQESEMIDAGGQLVFTLSSGAPAMGISGAAGFQGYLMARCAFQFAHGLAFITNGFGVGTASLAHGYLALVVPVSHDDRGVDAGGTEMLNN